MRSIIKHVSFGLWGTLIKTNPRFKSERLRYLSDITGKRTDDVESMSNTVNRLVNGANNPQFRASNAYVRYKLLFKDLGTPKGDKEVSRIYHDIEEIALKYTPDIYDKNTLGSLQRLSNTHKIAIISNTEYFTGETTHKLIKKLGIKDHIDLVVYSDEVGFAKPDREIFDHWIESTATSDKVFIDTYMHVGCNKEKDFDTPNKIGMHGFLINGTTLRGITSVNEYIKTYAH